MKNKKILLICNYFAPDNSIAAVRTSKLVKYFKRAGYDVSVIAEGKKFNLGNVSDSILENDVKGVPVIRVDNSELVLKIIDLYKKLIAPAKKKRFEKTDDRMRINPKTGKKEFYTFQFAYPIIGSLDYLFELLRQYDLFLNAKDALKQDNDADYLITSYGDFFVYYAGKYFHKKHKNIPWIFDIRDPIFRYKFTPEYLKRVALNAEKKVWKQAACIVGTSKGICKRVPKKYCEKVHYITNGFDVDDRNDKYEFKNNGKIVFSYTGSLYGGMYDLSPFFKSIALLSESGSIDLDEIEIRYAGNPLAYDIFRSIAEKFGVEKCCVYAGKLERKESLKLQLESDVLLLAIFDYVEGRSSTIAAKTYEYMSAERPVVAIICGDNPKNEVAAILKKCNIGYVFEEAVEKDNIEGLKKYLSDVFEAFRMNKKIPYDPNKQEINKYDYRNISKKFIKIFESFD